MEIRLAIEEDLLSINEIYNQAVRQRFCTAHLSEIGMVQRRAWFRGHDRDRFPVFVMERNSKVLGWVSLGPYRQDRQAFAHVAEVSYYVDEKARGMGIGSRLLEHAIQVAPEFGFSVLVAILLNRNPASIALLEKFGFESWAVMPGIALIDGRQADHLYYGFKL
jgi:L-amino acid N-acyltransferase YncA